MLRLDYFLIRCYFRDTICHFSHLCYLLFLFQLAEALKTGLGSRLQSRIRTSRSPPRLHTLPDSASRCHKIIFMRRVAFVLAGRKLVTNTACFALSLSFYRGCGPMLSAALIFTLQTGSATTSCLAHISRLSSPTKNDIFGLLFLSQRRS